jgi:hypothetical protein
MMRLQLVGIQENPEEVRSREAESSLEMSDKNDTFAGFRCRHDLSRRKPARDALRDSPGRFDPGYVGRSDLRPLQPERPWSWAELSSSEAELAVILEDAILMADTKRESRSPVVLVLSRGKAEGEVSFAGILISQRLARTEDLQLQLNREQIDVKYPTEEHP